MKTTLSSLVLLCCLWSSNVLLSGGQTETTESPQIFTTPWLTADPLLVDALLLAMGEAGETYELSTNIYTWNFAEIISIINASDPTWLYDGIETSLMVSLLPSIVISSLPIDVLIYRCLCDYIFITNETYTYYDLCITECNGTTIDGMIPEIDICSVYPLAHSKYDNPINEDASSLGDDLPFDVSGCGLACKAGKLLYGLTKEDQSFIDLFKFSGTCVCFVSITILAINQIIDIRNSSEPFYRKPLLHHIPYIISFALFILTSLMTLGDIIGKENIVCNLNDRDKTFSFYNPFHGASNVACTTFGVLFYAALLLYMLYSVLLSFVIFRQFYKPLNPLWKIRPLYFHILIFIIILFISAIFIIDSSIDGVYPMSVCLPGSSSQNIMFWSIFLPITMAFFTVTIFLLLSLCLLRSKTKEQEVLTNKNTMSNNKLIDLLKRMGLYCVGVLITLGLLSVTAYIFYSDYDKLRDGMDKNIQCELCYTLSLEYNLPCPEPEYLEYYNIMTGENNCEDVDRYRLNPLWFMTWTIACVMAIFAQLILSCTLSRRERVKHKIRRTISTTVNVGRKSATSIVSAVYGGSKNSNSKNGRTGTGSPYDTTNDTGDEGPADVLSVGSSGGNDFHYANAKSSLPLVRITSDSPHSTRPLQPNFKQLQVDTPIQE